MMDDEFIQLKFVILSLKWNKETFLQNLTHTSCGVAN